MRVSVPQSPRCGPGLERGDLRVGGGGEGAVLTLLTRLSCLCSQLQLGSTPAAPHPMSARPPRPGPERCGLGPGHGLSGPSKYWLQVEIRISAAALPPLAVPSFCSSACSLEPGHSFR